MSSVTSTMLRVARAALHLTVREVAAATGLSANTVWRIENGTEPLRNTEQRLRAFYEGHGLMLGRLDEEWMVGSRGWREAAQRLDVAARLRAMADAIEREEWPPQAATPV